MTFMNENYQKILNDAYQYNTFLTPRGSKTTKTHTHKF